MLLLAVSLASAVAACGDDDSSTSCSSASDPGVTRQAQVQLLSSRALQACLRRNGGVGTRVHPVAHILGVPVRDGFEVAHADGSLLSVALETTSDAADELQGELMGIIVDLEVVHTVDPTEPPAQMKARAAATVHRLGTVLVVYGNPRTDDDSSLRNCLTRPR